MYGGFFGEIYWFAIFLEFYVISSFFQLHSLFNLESVWFVLVVVSYGKTWKVELQPCRVSF